MIKLQQIIKDLPSNCNTIEFHFENNGIFNFRIRLHKEKLGKKIIWSLEDIHRWGNSISTYKRKNVLSKINGWIKNAHFNKQTEIRLSYKLISYTYIFNNSKLHNIFNKVNNKSIGNYDK